MCRQLVGRLKLAIIVSCIKRFRHIRIRLDILEANQLNMAVDISEILRKWIENKLASSKPNSKEREKKRLSLERNWIC